MSDELSESSIFRKYLGLFLLLGVYALSIFFIFIYDTPDPNTGQRTGDKRVVRLLHWSLEPGYREALQTIMDEYNALDHVIEEGYRVEQLAVPDKVYKQFLNTHLISGTAPDIVTKGIATLTAKTAFFFVPFSEHINRPNPYNAGVPEASDLSWQATFIDDLKPAFDSSLNEYYGVTASSPGASRVYYNKEIFAKAKQILLDELETDRSVSGHALSGLLERHPLPAEGRLAWGVEPDEGFVEWLKSDEPPSSTGQFFLLCVAIDEYARQTGRTDLIPISGDGRSVGFFQTRYGAAFLSGYLDLLDRDMNSALSFTEVLCGWEKGLWHLDDPAFLEYYALIRHFIHFMPSGVFGLDRDASNRRFVQGAAAMLAAGGYDARGLFSDVEGLPEESRFEVGVMEFPYPAEGEVWFDRFIARPTEITGNQGTTLSVFRLSEMREESIDFLQYLTSIEVNERFNKLAGWLPVVKYADPLEVMKPFKRRIDGIRGEFSIDILANSHLKPLIEGQEILYLSNDLEFEAFVAEIDDFLSDPSIGVNRYLQQENKRREELYRNMERTAGSALWELLDEENREPQSLTRYHRLLLESAQRYNGRERQVDYHLFFPETPFPGSGNIAEGPTD